MLLEEYLFDGRVSNSNGRADARKKGGGEKKGVIGWSESKWSEGVVGRVLNGVESIGNEEGREEEWCCW